MNFQSRKVLLVDDEPGLSSEPLAFSLESRDFECLFAADMTGAVSILEQNDISVLVTDVMMPPGSRFPKLSSLEAGFHLIDYVKKNWPRLPIICLSVIGDQAKIKRLTDRGVQYLRKGETPLSTAVETIAAAATGRRLVRESDENSNRRR